MVVDGRLDEMSMADDKLSAVWVEGKNAKMGRIPRQTSCYDNGK